YAGTLSLIFALSTERRALSSSLGPSLLTPEQATYPPPTDPVQPIGRILLPRYRSQTERLGLCPIKAPSSGGASFFVRRSVHAHAERLDPVHRLLEICVRRRIGNPEMPGEPERRAMHQRHPVLLEQRHHHIFVSRQLASAGA